MTKKKHGLNKKISNNGITLISLVVTIIVLIILAGVSINLVLGENGIITTAKRAKEEMTIAEGKEKIELAIAEMKIEKESKGESCTLDYISQNIETRAKGIVLEGVKGTPAVKMYLSYKDYMYKIESNLSVADIGNINIAEQPSIEIMRDVSQTGVEQVNLTVKATVDDGDISEIVKPDGSIEYASEVTYEVTENGNYTFKAVTEKGIAEEKTVNIEQIKLKNAIEIVTSSGTDNGDATVSCTHIYETKYDTSNHWKQCILCNNKIDTVAHNLTVQGEETCNVSIPAQIQYCTDGCGYKKTIARKNHGEDTSVTAAVWRNQHFKQCSICYNYTLTEDCKNTNGQLLGCKTGIAGTCVGCGENRTANHLELQNGRCLDCGKEFYTSTTSTEVLSQSQIKVKYKYVPVIENLNMYKGSNTGIGLENNVGTSASDFKFTKNDDGSIDIEAIINISSDAIAKTTFARGIFNYTYGESSNAGYVAVGFKTDNYAPTVKSITVSGADSSTEFSRSATITAKFEETWDSIVEMALYDSDGSVISNWSVASKEGTIFTKEFNVVAETTTSKELTVKAKDRCGNIAEGTVTIGKIDTKAPELVSEVNYNGEWKINLPIKIEATDEGSGNVEIALGSETDYQLGTLEGNKYTRSYNLVGDIYEDIVRILYLKDGVGNVVTKRINIGKLDRTSPTITNITNNSGTVKIEANDINTDLNKVGSGIKGYAMSKSKEIPADNGFQTNNTFEITETGTYYIWVKDNAGNYSETRQIEIN